MIIFYNKKTGDIFGKVDGRVHSEHTLKTALIKPGNVPDKDIGKYVIPFVPNLVEVVEPITEMRVVDKKTMRVEQVVVGKKKVKKAKGMKIDAPFAKFIYDVEAGKVRLFDYKVKLNKENKVEGFVKKGK